MSDHLKMTLYREPFADCPSIKKEFLAQYHRLLQDDAPLFLSRCLLCFDWWGEGLSGWLHVGCALWDACMSSPGTYSACPLWETMLYVINASASHCKNQRIWTPQFYTFCQGCPMRRGGCQPLSFASYFRWVPQPTSTRLFLELFFNPKPRHPC
jgi:hypothetical protein